MTKQLTQVCQFPSFPHHYVLWIRDNPEKHNQHISSDHIGTGQFKGARTKDNEIETTVHDRTSLSLQDKVQ